MKLDTLESRGLYLLGCGRMGTAMLSGWLAHGLPATAVWVSEPSPTRWLEELARNGLHLNDGLPTSPAVAVIAVKPQMMDAALPPLASLAETRTLILSVAAGTPLARFEAAFGARTPIIRAMPNTPAAIGKGITAIIGNPAARENDLELAESLLRSVGEVVRLSREQDMDAVTAVSGSGPAYLYFLMEALADAGIAEGLSPDLARQLARATVIGASALADQAPVGPDALRRDVTSPGGTTAAGLEVLMDDASGLTPLMQRTVAAAAARSRELGR